MESQSRTGYSPICARNASAETRASRCSVMIAPPTLITESCSQYRLFEGVVRAFG